jgi:hypothetical protein
MQRHRGTHTLSAFGLAAALFVALIGGNPTQSSADDVSGVITGYVHDQYNRPLADARVFLQSDDGPVAIRTVDRYGFFSFLAVLPGKYVVVSRLNGYLVTRACPFTIHPNQTKSVHFRMRKTISTIATDPVGGCPPADPPISF